VTLSDAPGCVYVVATPIGNLEDVSARALRVLREADCIACEDTRVTGKLCARFGIATPRLSLHAHNERRRIPDLLGRLERGASVALVSDAGTPLLSDPGAALVAAALERGVRVVPVPGPSAILAALVASGLPCVPFAFLGFPPRRGGARAAWLERARALPATLVLFEAPGRVAATLADLFAALGPRRVAVARELTKVYEEVVRGRLGELGPVQTRGEVAIVVAGVEPERDRGEPAAAHEVDAEIEAALDAGAPTREIARRVAERCDLPRSEAYARVLERARRRSGA
jgi:16S rRNA (cytidine1402-2'-O)-methyltransferase